MSPPSSRRRQRQRLSECSAPGRPPRGRRRDHSGRLSGCGPGVPQAVAYWKKTVPPRPRSAAAPVLALKQGPRRRGDPHCRGRAPRYPPTLRRAPRPPPTARPPDAGRDERGFNPRRTGDGPPAVETRALSPERKGRSSSGRRTTLGPRRRSRGGRRGDGPPGPRPRGAGEGRRRLRDRRRRRGWAREMKPLRRWQAGQTTGVTSDSWGAGAGDLSSQPGSARNQGTSRLSKSVVGAKEGTNKATSREELGNGEERYSIRRGLRVKLYEPLGAPKPTFTNVILWGFKHAKGL